VIEPKNAETADALDYSYVSVGWLLSTEIPVQRTGEIGVSEQLPGQPVEEENGG
jgi:hypothetical protein